MVERRGRWLLLTSDVFPLRSDKLLFVSTQVYGYDEYQVVPDESAAKSNYVRVIDNEGEDYLYLTQPNTSCSSIFLTK